MSKSRNSTPEKEEGEGLILPRDILLDIAKRNPSRLDASRIRSVCRHWRKSLPPPLRFPIKIPPPPGPSPRREEAVCFITESTFYADSASHAILEFEEEYRGGGFSTSVLLRNSAANDTKLKFGLPHFSKLSTTLTFLSNSYHIHHGYPRRSCRNYRNIGKYDFLCDLNVLKTVIVCSDATVRNPNYASLCDLMVVAHLYDRKLGVLRLAGGAMNNAWETDFCNSRFEDIVNHKGHLYAVDRLGALFVMKDSSLQMTQVAPACFKPPIKIPFPGNTKRLHLAVSSSAVVLGEDLLYMFDETKLYKLLGIVNSSGSTQCQDYSCCWVNADQDLPDQVFVQDVRCNFHVPMTYIGRYVKKATDHVCKWSEFKFYRVSVGFKNRPIRPFRERCCVFQGLPKYDHEMP